jgi:hypothetical protein
MDSDLFTIPEVLTNVNYEDAFFIFIAATNTHVVRT